MSNALLDAAQKIVQLNEQIAILESQVRDDKAFLAQRLGAGQHIVGNCRVGVTRAKRFSASHALDVLPDIWLSQVTKTMVDRELAKSTLPPALYELCQLESADYTVRVS